MLLAAAEAGAAESNYDMEDGHHEMDMEGHDDDLHDQHDIVEDPNFHG